LICHGHGLEELGLDVLARGFWRRVQELVLEHLDVVSVLQEHPQERAPAQVEEPVGEVLQAGGEAEGGRGLEVAAALDDPPGCGVNVIIDLLNIPREITRLDDLQP